MLTTKSRCPSPDTPSWATDFTCVSAGRELAGQRRERIKIPVHLRLLWGPLLYLRSKRLEEVPLMGEKELYGSKRRQSTTKGDRKYSPEHRGPFRDMPYVPAGEEVERHLRWGEELEKEISQLFLCSADTPNICNVLSIFSVNFFTLLSQECFWIFL